MMIRSRVAAHSTVATLAMVAAIVVAPGSAAADSNPFVGEIAATGIGFCPEGWAPAAGQLLAISQYEALYTLYGTTYGGDGVSTFALPDLQGRIPVGTGAGVGLQPRVLGQKGGYESVTLTTNQLASHSHAVNATNSDGTFAGPGGKLLAAAPTGGSGTETIYSDQPANRTMSSQMIASTGQGLPISTQDPTLVIRYCVALQGIFPTQS